MTVGISKEEIAAKAELLEEENKESENKESENKKPDNGNSKK